MCSKLVLSCSMANATHSLIACILMFMVSQCIAIVSHTPLTGIFRRAKVEASANGNVLYNMLQRSTTSTNNYKFRRKFFVQSLHTTSNLCVHLPMPFHCTAALIIMSKTIYCNVWCACVHFLLLGSILNLSFYPVVV